MKTSVIADADELYAELKNLFSWAHSVDMAYAWASSAGGKGRHWLAMDLAKVRHAVIGTEFAHTEPEALRVLGAKSDRLRLMINSTGTFHPKIILGLRGDRCKAIIGSANFTRAAFTTNTELSIVLEGGKTDDCFDEIQGFLDEQWGRGSELSGAWLDEYTKVWEAARRRHIIVPRAKLDITSITSLEMPWSEYVHLVEAQEGRELENGYKISVFGADGSYLKELADTRAIFAQERPFASLSKQDKNLLMGMGSSSGLLGTMKAAGYAKEVVNKTPEKVGAVLDRLPLEGVVSLTEAEALLNQLTLLRGVKIGVATRLFTVKRPDLFISVNNGSNPQLANLLGGKRITTVKRYIDLLRTVWSTEWYSTPEPIGGREATIWNRRAALLDAALYEQV